MLSVWCALCHTVHDFSFSPFIELSNDLPKLGDISPDQRRAVKCLKPDHWPYLKWSAREGCPNCGAALESELLLDFD